MGVAGNIFQTNVAGPKRWPPACMHNAPRNILSVKKCRAAALWYSGNTVELVNEVTLRQAGLVLKWVTVREYWA